MKTYRDKDICVVTIRGDFARRIKNIAEKQMLEPRAVAMALLRRGFLAINDEPIEVTEKTPDREIATTPVTTDDGPGF